MLPNRLNFFELVADALQKIVLKKNHINASM